MSWFLVLWSQVMGGGKREVQAKIVNVENSEDAIKNMQEYNRQKRLSTFDYLAIDLSGPLAEAELDLTPSAKPLVDDIESSK